MTVPVGGGPSTYITLTGVVAGHVHVRITDTLAYITVGDNCQIGLAGSTLRQQLATLADIGAAIQNAAIDAVVADMEKGDDA